MEATSLSQDEARRLADRCAALLCEQFRHLFCHTYCYDLEWKRVRELSQGLPEVLGVLKSQIAAFLSALADT